MTKKTSTYRVDKRIVNITKKVHQINGENHFFLFLVRYLLKSFLSDISDAVVFLDS